MAGQWMRARQLALLVVLVTPFLVGCGGDRGGQVLAEGENVAQFTTADGMYVVTKVEVFERGELREFPPGCRDRCSRIHSLAAPVVIWLRPPESELGGSEFVFPELGQACSRRFPQTPEVYIQWDDLQPVRCEFYVVQTDEERSALGFVPNLDLPPTRFRLHVFGASQPIGAP